MGEMPYFGLSTAPVSRRVTLANDNEHDKKEIQTQRYRNRHKSASRDAPNSILLDICHYKQKFNWDCGVSCVLMVLSATQRSDFLKNFNEICREQGFNKSTWTIDLCYLLSKFKVRHKFYTATIGVHSGYKCNSFYQNILTKDEARINKKFDAAKDYGLNIKRGLLSATYILGHILKGPVILLVNAKLLNCEQCKLNKLSSEIRKCLPWPVQYQGHYIIICGYNIDTQKVFYRNPSLQDKVCVMSLQTFEEARRCYGTDEDTILIYNS